MAPGNDARSERSPGRLGIMALSLAVTLVLVGAAAAIFWLGSSGPLPPPPITVEIAAAPPIVAPPAPMPVAEATPPPAPSFPDPSLLENGQSGPLPIIAADGRMARQVYARPFDMSNKLPRIAIVIDDLGSSVSLTHDAIHALPPAVSLSFMPYRHDLPALTAEAHAAGHEILLDLPMEPPDPQHHDPGSNALRNALDAPTNIGRLNWMMAQATGYVGMSAFLGGRFASDRADLAPILKEINRRGLLYVDNHAAAQSVAPMIAGEIGLPFVMASVTLDTDQARNAVDQRLAELEQDALRDGQAVGIAAASESVLQRISVWADSLADRKLALAPISALVQTPKPALPAGAKN